MINKLLDEYNYMVWTAQYEELKFLLLSEEISFNDVDTKGKTLLMEALASAELSEENGVMKPAARSLDFIEWLILHGADVNSSEGVKPIEYALRCECEKNNESGKQHDFTEMFLLLKKLGAETEKFDELINSPLSERIKYSWDV